MWTSCAGAARSVRRGTRSVSRAPASDPATVEPLPAPVPRHPGGPNAHVRSHCSAPAHQRAAQWPAGCRRPRRGRTPHRRAALAVEARRPLRPRRALLDPVSPLPMGSTSGCSRGCRRRARTCTTTAPRPPRSPSGGALTEARVDGRGNLSTSTLNAPEIRLVNPGIAHDVRNASSRVAWAFTCTPVSRMTFYDLTDGVLVPRHEVLGDGRRWPRDQRHDHEPASPHHRRRPRRGAHSRRPSLPRARPVRSTSARAPCS